MTNRAAFVHRPKNLTNEVFLHPVHTKELWGRVWDAARQQDWFEDKVGCVGNEGGYFYFQISGLTTGFARVKVEA